MKKKSKENKSHYGLIYFIITILVIFTVSILIAGGQDGFASFIIVVWIIYLLTHLIIIIANYQKNIQKYSQEILSSRKRSVFQEIIRDYQNLTIKGYLNAKEIKAKNPRIYIDGDDYKVCVLMYAYTYYFEVEFNKANIVLELCCESDKYEKMILEYNSFKKSSEVYSAIKKIINDRRDEL